jgi:hypothetical protein
MTDEPQDAPTLEERAAQLERRLAEMEASTTQRLIRAELKAEAVRARMVDLDGLKLVDMAGLTLSEQGDVTGASGLMAQLRRSKPWLFGAASSSSAAPAPPAQPPAARQATAMSHAEWQAARAELLKRR